MLYNARWLYIPCMIQIWTTMVIAIWTSGPYCTPWWWQYGPVVHITKRWSILGSTFLIPKHVNNNLIFFFSEEDGPLTNFHKPCLPTEMETWAWTRAQKRMACQRQLWRDTYMVVINMQMGKLRNSVGSKSFLCTWRKSWWNIWLPWRTCFLE